MFYITVMISNVGRSPITHVHNCFSETVNTLGIFTDFVTKKNAEIVVRWNWLLSAEATDHSDGWGPMWNVATRHGLTNIVSIDGINKMIVRVLLFCFVDYDIRITCSLVNTFPRNVAHFLNSPPAVECPIRQELSTQLLSARGIVDLDGSSMAWKLICIFKYHFQYVAATGNLTNLLFLLLSDILDMLLPTNQYMESCMSRIKGVSRASPSISKELLSARVVIKEALSRDLMGPLRVDEKKDRRFGKEACCPP